MYHVVSVTSVKHIYQRATLQTIILQDELDLAHDLYLAIFDTVLSNCCVDDHLHKEWRKPKYLSFVILSSISSSLNSLM